MAPGLLVGQAIGRIGCWFNQELYGQPTNLPWGLWIDPAHRPPDSLQQPYYHPTFAYEALWDLGTAGALVWAQRRFGLDRGRVFVLYVAGYTAGRGWIELLRVDPANHILGLRLNVWTSVLLFLAALAYLLLRRTANPFTPAPRRADMTAAATVAATSTHTREADPRGAGRLPPTISTEGKDDQR